MKINIMKDFENIAKGDEVEIILKNRNESVNGKVVENNLKQLYIRIDETSTDTTIRYEQIKSLKTFK